MFPSSREKTFPNSKILVFDVTGVLVDVRGTYWVRLQTVRQ